MAAGGKHGSISALAALLALVMLCAAAPPSAAVPPITRVEVVAPSMPLTDVYTTAAIVARTGSGEIDRSFWGDVWLWTDGPWVRPFHARFTAADRGVIFLPLKFDLPIMQRVEAYSRTGVIQTWSDPVFPMTPDYGGPRLLWGKLGDCAAPGQDFCIAENGEVPPKVQTGRPVLGVPLFITGVSKPAAGGTWHVIVNPGLERSAQAELIKKLKAADKPEKIVELAADHDGDMLLAVPAGDQLSERLPPHLLVLTGAEGNSKEAFIRAWPVAEEHGPVIAVVADRGGWIGAWCAGGDAADIWTALRRGDAYASWGGRTFIDWKGNFTAADVKKESWRIRAAGAGPREELDILRENGRGLVPAASWSTDDFRLDVSLPREAAGAHCFILANSGLPRGAHALAGPVSVK